MAASEERGREDWPEAGSEEPQGAVSGDVLHGGKGDPLGGELRTSRRRQR